jgi:peptidoglycan-associated lipoprotein
MKRNLIIMTLVVFAFSSIFLLSSCAKKQVVTGEEEITAAPKEEVAKVEPEKEKAPVTEVAKEVEEEKVVAEKPMVEEKPVVEEKAIEEKAVVEEKLAVEEKAVVEEKPVVEEKAEVAKFDEEAAWRERMASRVEAESIYFDFDRSFIKPEYRPILDTKAEFLKDNPEYSLRIEGNCDERGTNEYNLALGERRADSVKNYLVSLGISPDRVETISYGEERPLAVGHNEDSWSQNRRDDFVILEK